MSDIQALLVEREGYLRRGLKNRAAQVDAALAALGFAAEPAAIETATAVQVAAAPKPPKPRQTGK